MPQKLNAKGKPFTWSFSAQDLFYTCPYQYAGRHFYCTTPFIETEHTIWGNRVHKAGENLIKGIPPKDDEAMAPVLPYVTALFRTGNKPEAEVEIALTRNFTPTTWWAKDVWLRVKIDIVMPKGEIGKKDRGKEKAVWLGDWKTGKIKDSEDQLKLSIAALATVRPWYEEFDAKYIWLKDKVVTGIKPVTKAGIPKIWEYFLQRVERVENAWESEIFPCRTSGLCRGWCQVESCVHWQPRRK